MLDVGEKEKQRCWKSVEKKDDTSSNTPCLKEKKEKKEKETREKK